jgi:hypothetical protein
MILDIEKGSNERVFSSVCNLSSTWVFLELFQESLVILVIKLKNDTSNITTVGTPVFSSDVTYFHIYVL